MYRNHLCEALGEEHSRKKRQVGNVEAEGRPVGLGRRELEEGWGHISTCCLQICSFLHPSSTPSPCPCTPRCPSLQDLSLSAPWPAPSKLIDFWESRILCFFWKFGSWQRASAIFILCGKYRITVNYIEKLDSFTAVIIYLPICLRELAAGEKIKCNLGKKKKSLLICVWQGESLLSEFTLCQSGGFL